LNNIKLIISTCFCFCATLISAQDIDTKAIEFAKSITVSDLSRHLHIISSDEYEGRETGLKGQKLTEEYLTNFYESVGIKKHQDTYLQYFDVILRDPKKVDVGTTKKKFEFLKDYYYYPGIKDTAFTGEVIFAGYGINDTKYNDFDGLDLRNKIAVIKDGEPKDFMGNYVITESGTPGKWTTIREKKSV